MSKDYHPSRKKFTRFSSKLPFEFGMPNVSIKHTQKSDGSPLYFTRASSLLRRQVLENAKEVTIKSDNFHPQVLKRDRWIATDFSNARVLFLLPSDALGDCVGMAMFMQAFKARYPDSGIGVLNSASASDIFSIVPDLSVFQLFISSRELAKFTHVIDLSEMEGWSEIAQMPVNTEETLCEAFGIDPLPLEKAKRNIGAGAKIGIAPMASAPLRTLPPRLVREIANLLAQRGYIVSILLNAYQGLMPAYKAAIGSFDTAQVRYLDGFPTVGELLHFVESQDYMILADSGPAHITKLFQTPGLAIYTSASGQTLQGRHKNLRIWQSTYSGSWCSAPCGLAKLRATEDGKIGCMGSLQVSLDELVGFPSIRNKGMAETFTLARPVPCVKQLSVDLPEILDLIVDDIG